MHAQILRPRAKMDTSNSTPHSVVSPFSRSVAIRPVKQAIVSDLDTRYQDPDVYMLMNKFTLLDPCLKSLAHLTEEQEATINSLVYETVACSLLQFLHQ